MTVNAAAMTTEDLFGILRRGAPGMEEATAELELRFANLERSRLLTARELADASELRNALACVEAAVNDWCEVAKLGPCVSCDAVGVMYEPWAIIELRMVAGYQNKVPAKMGAFSAEASMRMHRDADNAGGYCVAELSTSEKSKGKTARAALMELTRKMHRECKRLKKAGYAMPECEAP
jgi:hypothetical protein